MNLSELKEGEKGIIAKVKGQGAFRRRIMEMGFVAGKEVEVIKYAPLKDPIEYSIMGYEVSIRKDEAQLIELYDIREENTLNDLNYYGTQTEERASTRQNLQLKKHIKIAFVGNPNCGKTTIFNTVTGLNEKVGNYGGVTVDSKTANYKRQDYIFEITDLPGTYSLTAYSPEELFVRNHIINEMPDIIVNVIDGSNLERNLYLTTQLIDMDLRVVGAINMYDELESNGDKLKIQELSELLGIPFVTTVGKRKIGIDQLFDKIVEVFEDRNPITRHIHINYGKCLEKSVQLVQEKIKSVDNRLIINKISSRFLAIKLLEEDKHAQDIIKKCSNSDEILALASERIKNIESTFNDKAESAITDAKYGFIDGALKETFKKAKKTDKRIITKIIDDIITNKLYSFPLFILLMWIMFQATFFVGAYPQDWLTWIVNQFGIFTSKFLPDGIIKAIIVDGIIGGVGGVLVFIPNILILFLFISLMEDTGYMARVAFIMDKIMHRVGLHGRSFIPLLMGFGCNVPAIMATRTIEGKNDRLITILITPFMSCSARLPVYVLIISAFFPKNPGSMLFLVYTIGVLMAGIMALVFRKTLLKAKELPFVMELPPYRIPTTKTIIKHMWFKAALYLKKMAGVIMIASLIIWALSYFPQNIEYNKDYTTIENNLHDNFKSLIINASSDKERQNYQNELDQKLIEIEMAKKGEQIEKSLIGRIGKFIEPAVQPLGFDWKMGVGLLTGMAAKEIVVSTMGVLYQTDVESSTHGLTDKLKEARYQEGPRIGQKVYNKASAFAFLIFILFYFPCVAVISAVRHETGKWKWAIFVAIYTTGLAWIFSFLAYQIGLLII